MSGVVRNPLSETTERIIEANDGLELCPNPDCDLTPEAVDVGMDGRLYVSHEEDGVGLNSRSPRGQHDGCYIDAEHDPTVEDN